MKLLPEAAAQLLYSVSPAHLCQAAFALASCAVLAVAVTPSRERKLLVNYGARSHAEPTADTAAAARQKDDDILLRSVRTITSVGQVPHMWFFTFYATYILCAVFWAGQYLLNGSILCAIASRQVQLGPSQATNGHVAVAWCLMLLQAARRLYESWAFAKPSKSTMWIVHWLLGQLFYVGISVAIWVEGSGMSCSWALLSGGGGAWFADLCGRHPLAKPVALLDTRAHGGRSVQGGHRGAAVLLRLDLTVPLSQASGGPQEVFTARARPVSTPDQSPLYLRMLDLLVIGNCRSPRGTLVQPDAAVRAVFCGCEPRCDGSRDQELVYRQVWVGQGGAEEGHDSLCVLRLQADRLSTL